MNRKKKQRTDICGAGLWRFPRELNNYLEDDNISNWIMSLLPLTKSARSKISVNCIKNLIIF